MCANKQYHSASESLENVGIKIKKLLVMVNELIKYKAHDIF